ncbi:MAG: ISL3 family transposase [Chloroflexi bacterium]|nr:ISL3 family transposase [Chloroflexota bacterium]
MIVSLAATLMPGCKIEEMVINGHWLTIHAHTTSATAACPACAQLSNSVHTYYTRSVQDVPIGERAVRLRLRVRRFRCLNRSCSKRTFAERLPTLLEPYAQKTTRLVESLYHTAQALGGKAGARVVSSLHMPTSSPTLLRILHRQFRDTVVTPRVLGVDDWAKRKGQNYGTILVDLERHRVVDLLPDRTAETLEKWLKEHPGVEVVTRDRSTEYARGISNGATTAQQVADRWHLLLNLRQMLERFLSRLYGRLKLLPGFPAASAKKQASPRRGRFRRSQNEMAVSLASRARRLTRHEEIQRRKHEGQKIHCIAKEMKLTRTTVRLSYYGEQFPERNCRRPLPSILDPFLPYLEQRHEQGCENASQLWREIQTKGYPGTRRQVSQWMQTRRTKPAPTTRKNVQPSCPVALSLEALQPGKTGNDPLPSAKQLAWLMGRDPKELTEEDKTVLQQIQQDQEVAIVYPLAQQFMTMVRQHQTSVLDTWLDGCAKSRVSNIQTFAEGIRQDYSAVRSCLKTSWSNGQTEGQVNRLKLLKREMYGRASLELLRLRMLYSAPLHQS